MFNYNTATARFATTAWEAMENEYDTIQFNAARAGLFESDIEADNEVRTRKGKLNRQTAFTTKLSDEQVEMLEDWHDLTSLAEAGYCNAPGHLKLVDEQGRKLLFHHWNKGDKASRSLRRAWKWADHVICCHSASLPADVRCKAAVLKGGPVKGIKVITSWYNEPVIDKAEAEFITGEWEMTPEAYQALWMFEAQLKGMCH